MNLCSGTLLCAGVMFTDQVNLCSGTLLCPGVMLSQMKQFWLGPQYRKEGVAGNDVSRSNIPDIRVAFRYETFLEELSTLFHTAKDLSTHR